MNDQHKVINIDFLRQCLSYDTVGQHLLSCCVPEGLVAMCTNCRNSACSTIATVLLDS